MAAIELVTFDLGNVLFLLDHEAPIREFARLSKSPEERVHQVVYSRESEVLVETGVQTWPDYVTGVRREIGLDISEAQFAETFNRLLVPNIPVWELVERVSKHYRVALCSNIGPSAWEHAREQMPFSRLFDPAIVSFEVGAMKPDRRIYEELISRSRLTADAILFIDDLEENVEGARDAGLNAVQFVGVDRLRADLGGLGVSA